MKLTRKLRWSNCRLMVQVWEGRETVIAPSQVFQALCRRVPHFRKRRQQDSVEVCRGTRLN